MEEEPQLLIDKIDDYWWLVTVSAFVIGEGVFQSHGATIIGLLAGVGLYLHANHKYNTANRNLD